MNFVRKLFCSLIRTEPSVFAQAYFFASASNANALLMSQVYLRTVFLPPLTAVYSYMPIG